MVEVVVIILNWSVFLVHDAMQLNPDVTFKGLIAYWTGRQILMYLCWYLGWYQSFVFQNVVYTNPPIPHHVNLFVLSVAS